MKRVACIRFPNWPIQRLVVSRPELEAQPLLAYVATGRRGAEVVACSQAARRNGVQPGQPLAEAQSLSPQAEAVEYDPLADRESLIELARWCVRFSPRVGLEDSDHPDSLLLDVTGCAHLFGGELGWGEAVVKGLGELGYHVRVALAETIGCAWGAAHYSLSADRVVVIPSGQQAAAIQRLPLESLRLPDKAVDTLRELGLETASLLDIPRSTLPSRFGTIITQRIDQALGRVVELFVPERLPEPIEVTWSGEHPVRNQLAVQTVLSRLLGQIVDRLETRGEGVLELRCRLDGPESATERFTLRLVQPTASRDHLAELLRLRLERLTGVNGSSRKRRRKFTPSLTAGITDVALLAAITAPLEIRRRDLFGHGNDADDARELDVLLDRLVNRLGRGRVVEPVLVEEVLPERGWEGGIQNPEFRIQKRTGSIEILDSGFWIPNSLHLPISLSVMSVFPDGPPIRFRGRDGDRLVNRCWGPERVETGWWRDDAVRRDYYRVETERGEWLWLFRGEEGGWFWQGEFV